MGGPLPAISSIVLCLIGFLHLTSFASSFVTPSRATIVRNRVFDLDVRWLGREAPTTMPRRVRRVGRVMMGRRAAKIARTKGKEDAKRGKVFARIGKKLIMAVKAGGPNEESNKLLADVIKEAKVNSVPKDNIARAIKRAVDGSQGDFKEAIYEAYGHGGTGLVVTALTDNANRAIADVKTAFKKHGLKQAASGSVLFQFAKKGRVEVQGEVDEEKVIEAAIDAGIDDVEVQEGDDEGTWWVLTDPKDLTLLAGALEATGIHGEPSLALLPKALAEVGDEEMESNLAAMEALMELDDVDTVDHNMA